MASNDLTNVAADQLAAQIAHWAAQLEFQKERFSLLEQPQFAHMQQMDIDKLAFLKAQQTWKEAFEEASVTGTYKGQPSIQWLTQQAQLTGVLNGSQTLQGKLTDGQLRQMDSQIGLDTQRVAIEKGRLDLAFETQRAQEGQERARLGLATRTQESQEAQETRRFGLAAKTQEAQEAQGYLGLLTSLQGPGNAFKQLRALGAGQGSVADLAQSWMGKYEAPGFGGAAQANPGRATMGDILGAGQDAGVVPGGWASPFNASGGTEAHTEFASSGTGADEAMQPSPYASQFMPGYTASPSGTQANVGAWNYQPTPTGQTQVYPPGVTAPPNQAQISTTVPTDPYQAGELAASGTAQAQTQPTGGVSGQAGLDYAYAAAAPFAAVNPRQFNAQNYATTNKYAQKLGWAALEEATGWDSEAAQDEFKKSLPKYSGPAKGAVKAF